MNYFWFYAVFWALLFFKLFWDLRARRKGRIINHAQSALIDVALYIAAGIYFIGFWDMGAFIISCLWLRWILFDLGWNWLTGNHPFYCGENSKLDVWADEFDGIEDDICKAMFWTKIGGLILTGILIWVTLHF